MKLKIAILFSGLAFFLYRCQNNPYQQGEILYNNFCANCHMEDGSGLEGLIPPLNDADYLRSRQEQLPCIIRYGIEEELVVNGITYTQPMAGIDRLTDFEIANVINYINHAWENDIGFVKFDEVKNALDSCTDRDN